MAYGGKDLSGNAELALGGPGEHPFGIPKRNREKWNTELADRTELDVEIGPLGFLFSVELN
ncbi:MAG: hypothetical protein GY864_14305 [Desulfobacterales bacterium]|nr:hypothetical protein [Desulfobacterales bacterium]